MLNRSIVTAGLFTILGAMHGAFQSTASASAIEVAPVLITAEPVSACTEWHARSDGSVLCHDDGAAYDSDHFMVERDTDGEGFYLAVWQ
jgi:hypothetical protein